LGNVGAAQIKIPACKQKGLELLQQSLEIALQNAYHEHAGRAYTNLAYSGVITKDYELAEKAVETGILYCEENNLGLWTMYLLIIEAKLKLEKDKWQEAYNTANRIIKNEQPSNIIKIFALTILATVKMRRGDKDDILPLLKEAKDKAFEAMELQRILQALTAYLEYEWLTGRRFIEAEDLKNTIEMIRTRGNIYANSCFVFWLQKARGQSLSLKEIYEGYDISNSAKAEKAAMLWKEIGCPYNEALTLFEGSDDNKRKAITIVQNIGADAVYQKMKLEMRSVGIKNIPRGLRESTKTNPAQLTNRELDVLQLLQKGIQNKEIAGTLFISPKTADHHISSILFKLDVNSRTKAVTEAVRLGILK
jgi:ATP/maltotriose-dependent transcriptional regulator MalT